MEESKNGAIITIMAVSSSVIYVQTRSLSAII